MSFLILSDDQVFELIVSRLSEFGDYEVTLEDFNECRARLVVEKFEHGVAVMLFNDVLPQLWFLYVDPEQRCKGLGRKYVRLIRRKFGNEYVVSLHCHKSLRPFYGSCGFRVVERYGDHRVMESWGGLYGEQHGKFSGERMLR